MKPKLFGLKKPLLRKKLLLPVAVCVVAVLFLVLGNLPKKTSESESEEQFSAEEYIEKTERRLEELLSKIDGVGKCEVMITVSSSERSVYLSDAEKKGDNSSTSHIKIKTGGNEQPVVEVRYMPSVAGVAVVCEGAGSVSVRSEVAEIVSGVLGVDRTIVSVAKRK